MSKIKLNKLSNGNVYLDGVNLLGRAEEVTLPTVKQQTTDHKALGMYGASEVNTGLDKMEAKFKWTSVFAEVARGVADPRTSALVQVRGNLETHDASGLAAEKPYVVELGGRFRENSLGSLKQGEPVTPEDTMFVHYMRQVVDGEEIVLIDVFNNIYRVNGEDLLATYRANIGA